MASAASSFFKSKLSFKPTVMRNLSISTPLQGNPSIQSNVVYFIHITYITTKEIFTQQHLLNLINPTMNLDLGTSKTLIFFVPIKTKLVIIHLGNGLNMGKYDTLVHS